jgi:hypothetical protein
LPLISELQAPFHPPRPAISKIIPDVPRGHTCPGIKYALHCHEEDYHQFTIISVIGTVAMILVYGGLRKVKIAMLELAEEKELLMAATNEMEINMNGIAMLVFKYMNTPNPRYRQRVDL